MTIEIVRTIKHFKPRGFGCIEVDRKVGLCECGKEVELLEFTNTCKCGRDYNMSGELLASRSQWGEETGESLDEILSIGHHQSE